MRSMSVWMDKHREKVWFSLLINAGLLLLYVMLFRPAYETNDDLGLANMVSGVTGLADAHLVYINYVLGFALEICYKVIPGIPWFPVFQYAALFGAFSAITYVLIRRMKSPSSVWFSMVVTGFFAYEGYIKLQYTKTAGIVSAAGLLLILYGAEKERISRKAVAAGCLLAAVGFMYRKNQFLAEGALMTGIVVSMLLKLKISGGQWQRRILAWASAAGVLLILVAGLELADRYAYRSEKWQDYLAFNDARTELFDYGFPNYSEYEEVYESLQINRTAYNLYRSNNFLDTEKFTTEVMETLISVKPEKTFTKTVIKDFLDQFPVKFFTIPSFYCFLLVCLYWLLWGNHRVENWLTLIYEAAAVGVLYLYLFYEGRYLYNRVDTGLWLAVSLVVLWLFSSGRSCFSNRVGLAMVLSVFSAFQVSWRRNWRINTTDKAESRLEERQVIETVNSDQDHLYLKKSGLISPYKAYGVFDVVPFGRCNNMLTLGGWPSGTDSYQNILERYGIVNPYCDMIGNEKVCLIDNNIEATMEYIHTYYDEDAEAVLISELGELKIYQILD